MDELNANKEKVNNNGVMHYIISHPINNNYITL